MRCEGNVTALVLGSDVFLVPVRYVQGDVVLKASASPGSFDSAIELFASPGDASWAMGSFAFESKGGPKDRRSAVWRFVFDESDQDAVQAFLDGPECAQ